MAEDEDIWLKLKVARLAATDPVIEPSVPRIRALAAKGIESADQAIRLASALIDDLASERVKPTVASQINNALGKILKAAELQQRYGLPTKDGSRKRFLLAGE